MSANNMQPSGWTKTKISKVSHIIRGVSYAKGDSSEYLQSGLVPILRATNIQDEKLILDSNLVFVPSKYIKPEQYIKPGDIVVCMSSGSKKLVGKAAQLNQEWNGSFGTFCATIRPNSEICPKYLGYYFLTPEYRQFIRAKSAGININNLKPSDFDSIEIPTPSLPEQERIVAKIEELFSQLDAGVAALKRVQAGLKRYKASVLKAACEGRLVPQEEAAESVDTHLKSVAGKDYAYKTNPPSSSNYPSIPKGWAYGKLESLIYIAGRIGWRGLKAEEYTSEGPMLLSVYNLNKGDKVDFEDVNHISDERYIESPEVQIQENDILLAKDGAGIGKIGIIKNLPGPATVNSSLLVIRSSEIFIPEFLLYYLQGPQMQSIVRERITGSATPHLFQRDIKQFILLIPPLNEQKRIVAEIEQRVSLISKIEKITEMTFVRSKRLRQSILKRAFEGRL